MTTKSTPIQQGLERAIQAAGSASELARKLGVRRQAISQWKQVPAAKARTVSEITGISLHELRPDLWEPPAREAAE